MFALLLAVYTITASGWIESSDGQLMYRVAQSLAEEGTSAVPEGYLSMPGVDGRRYAPTGLGISLLIAPLYLLGRGLEGVLPEPLAAGRFATDSYPAELCASMLPAISQAATAALLVLLGARLGFAPRVRVGLALLYGLATVAWPDAKHFFAHPPATALLLGAACAAHASRSSGRRGPAALAGALCGAALLVYVNAGLAVPAIALYLAGVEQPRAAWAAVARLTGAFLAGLAPGVVGILAYNAARFGSPLETGYGASGNHVQLGTPILYGLYGLLLSSGKSLFAYSPPLLLALVSFRGFARSHRGEAMLVATLAGSYLVVVAKLNVWHGDWAWGPRYVAPLVPFAMLPAGAFLAQRGARRIAAAVAVAAVGGAVQLLGVLVAYETHLAGVPNALVRELHELYSEAHFVPQKSPLVGHARLAARAWDDLRAHLREAASRERILFGRGWIEPERSGGTTIRRALPVARILVPANGRARKLSLTLDDGDGGDARPRWPPAELRLSVDGSPVAEVWVARRGRSFTATPLTLPRRIPVSFEIDLPAAAPAHLTQVQISCTPWRDRQTGGRELGVVLGAAAVDGRAASLDGDLSWEDTGFVEKNTLVHRSFDLWWIRVLYSDLPRALLAVPAACLLAAGSAAAALVRRL